jgi:multidrug efflux pump subunit AcrB
VVFSWIVSGLFTPYLAVKMLPDSRKTSPGRSARRSLRDAVLPQLRRAIDFALERRWWVIGATVAALAASLPR